MTGILFSYKTALSSASPYGFALHHLLYPSCYPQGYMEQDVYNILLRILSMQE